MGDELKANHDLKRHAQVLRDFALNAKPHVLERPKRSLPSKFPMGEPQRIEQHVRAISLPVFEGALNLNSASASASVLAPAPIIPLNDRYSEGIEVGRKEGLDEGIAFGRAEALKEYERDLEIERSTLFDQAVQEGLAQGRAQGIEQGLVDADQQIKAQISSLCDEIKKTEQVKRQQFDQVVETTSNAMHHIMAGAEDQMLEICFSFICKVLGEQTTSREGLSALLRHHMLAVNEASMQIGLHQDDLELLRGDTANDSLLENTAKKSVTFYADNEVVLGGAIYRAKEMTLDARLEQQIALLKETLIEIRRKNGDRITQTIESDSSK